MLQLSINKCKWGLSCVFSHRPNVKEGHLGNFNMYFSYITKTQVSENNKLFRNYRNTNFALKFHWRSILFLSYARRIFHKKINKIYM